MPRKFPPVSQILSGDVVLEISFYSKKTSLLHDASSGGGERCAKGCGCDCAAGKIDVRLILYRVLYRFLLLACYFLFLGGFWRSILMLKRSVHKRSCLLNQRTTRRRTWDATTGIEQENYITFEDELIDGVFYQETADWDSSGDSIGDDVHFVTYVEESEDDGFQDDDYSDILTYSHIFADDHQVDLEMLLEQQEIDWDAPVPMVFEKPLGLDDSFSAAFEQGTFFDDDYSTVMGAGWPDFDIESVADFLEDSYFPTTLFPSEDSCIEADMRETSTVPLFDEEVLAAITGLAEPEFHSTIRLLKSVGSSEHLYWER